MPKLCLHSLEISYYLSAANFGGVIYRVGFPDGSAVKNPPAMQEMRVLSLGWEDPLGEGMQPTPVFLPGESHGQRSLAGYSPLGHKVSDND